MTAAPEIKYTDRDVREDGRLAGVAVNYVMTYGGEFEPLVRAKNYYEANGELTTVLVRVVLNCMRHDERFAGQLPTPRRRIVSLEEHRERRRRSPFVKRVQWCGDVKPHERHHARLEEEIDDYTECLGVEYKINRPREIRVPARIKRPYASSRQGLILHMTTGHGWSTWLPKSHEWGWREPYVYRFQSPRNQDLEYDFFVKLRCKNPSILKNPVLITNDDMPDWLEMMRKTKSSDYKICPRCLPVTPK